VAFKTVMCVTAAGNYLFFGCRNHDKDFYFHDEWRRLEAKSLMTLFTAFSRDQVLTC